MNFIHSFIRILPTNQLLKLLDESVSVPSPASNPSLRSRVRIPVSHFYCWAFFDAVSSGGSFIILAADLFPIRYDNSPLKPAPSVSVYGYVHACVWVCARMCVCVHAWMYVCEDPTCSALSSIMK